MMRIQQLTLVVLLAAIPVFAGCGGGEAPPPKRTPFLHDNPWVVKAPTEAPPAPGAPPAPPPEKPKPKPVTYKPDTEVVHPIFEANGKWTVRVAFYNPNPRKKLSALHYANDHCRTLRRQGYEAYVTDLISLAIVSVGSFSDDRDPKLVDTWREAHEAWLKLRGGKKSTFQEDMDRHYGGRTVFGDQPRPVSIIDLQVKMKGVYKIPLTEEDKRRHKEYLSERVHTGENP
ncbi:MAG TPA: hypothetical protein VMZ92_00120 [Planctomycetota bacterium]|nr:hypothetical protein [Planctomycetota bacterium]